MGSRERLAAPLDRRPVFGYALRAMATRDAFSFVVLSDTHIRPEPEEGPCHYLSTAAANGRCRYAVRLIREFAPDLVVHLGDVQHPIPALKGYDEALGLAKAILGELDCPLHVVPGNHDVGDKRGTWAGAPELSEESLGAYEGHWGRSFGSFDHRDCHFVLVNAQLLNSGLAAEEEQRRWLGGDLANAAERGQRIFIFSHYATYLTAPDEQEHYDNLAEPARSWLLGLLTEHRVEAFFAGHAHHFFYNRHDASRLYVAPSTAFVRADFAEMFPVEPAGEFGRDDHPKMGFLLVRVDTGGHSVEFIRTHGLGDDAVPSLPDLRAPSGVGRGGGWAAPVCVNLRHDIAQVIKLPTASLDEFARKPVRDDYPLLALWGAGLRQLRIPIGDLDNVATAERMRALVDDGHRFTVASAGTPGDADRIALTRRRDLVDTWEVCLPWSEMTDGLAAATDIAREAGCRLHLSKIETLAERRRRGREGFGHFVRRGFETGDRDTLAEALGAKEARGAVDRVVFRVGPADAVFDVATAATNLAGEFGAGAALDVQFQGSSHAACNDDDLALSNRVAESLVAALATGTEITFDTLNDCDRGYFPRHGLIDRRGNPRPQWYVLRHLNAALAGRSEGLRVTPIAMEMTTWRVFRLAGQQLDAALVLPSQQGVVGPVDPRGMLGAKLAGAPVRWLCLASGRRLPATLRALPGLPERVVVQLFRVCMGPGLILFGD